MMKIAWGRNRRSWDDFRSPVLYIPEFSSSGHPRRSTQSPLDHKVTCCCIMQVVFGRFQEDQGPFQDQSSCPMDL